jgi:hypothetical protein
MACALPNSNDRLNILRDDRARKTQHRILLCSMLDHQANDLISMDDRADLIGLWNKVLQ